MRALDQHDKAAAASASSAGEQPHQLEPPGLLTLEALLVGRSLRHDMEKAGIHLPDEQRSRLTQLIGLERRLGMAFGQLRALSFPCMDMSPSTSIKIQQGFAARGVQGHQEKGTLPSLVRLAFTIHCCCCH